MACFVIQGATIMSHVRALVAEGQFRQAFQVLKDGFELEDATYMDILKGKLTITGDSSSGMELIECDETDQVKKSLDDIAFNYFAINGRTHRVVAVLRKLAIFPEKDEEDEQYDVHWTSSLNKAKNFVKAHHLQFSDKDIPVEQQQAILTMQFAQLLQNGILSHLSVGYAYDTDKLPVLYLSEEASIDLPYWYSLPSVPSLTAISYATDISCDMPNCINFVSLIQGKEALPTCLVPEEIRYKRENAEHEQNLQNLKKAITDYADSDDIFGWEHIPYEDNGLTKVLRVPRHAYLSYFLKSHGFLLNVLKSPTAKSMHPDLARALAHPYKPFCTSGLKMQNDDPSHTDAWLGAGLDLEDAYNRKHPASNAFYNHGSVYLYTDTDKQSLHVLSKGTQDTVSGAVATMDTIQHVPAAELKNTILCLPFADTNALVWAVKCKAVIVEQGGKLAHMVLVSREQRIPVVRIDKAMTRISAHNMVHLDLKEETWLVMTDPLC